MIKHEKHSHTKLYNARVIKDFLCKAVQYVASVDGHADCHTFEDRAACDANSEKMSTHYEIDQYHYQSSSHQYSVIIKLCRMSASVYGGRHWGQILNRGGTCPTGPHMESPLVCGS